MIYILFFYFFCYGHSFIFFVMRRFIDESSEKKNHCAAGEFERGVGGTGRCKPSQVGSKGEAPKNFGYFAL